jgi:hypothetical protein
MDSASWRTCDGDERLGSAAAHGPARLLAQLARRHQHDGAPAGLAQLRQRKDFVEDGQQVGQRLAAAGARARDDVLALERARHGRRLHRRRPREAALGQRAQQARVQAQLLEGGRHDPGRARRGAWVRRLERALFSFSLSRAFYYPTTIIA